MTGNPNQPTARTTQALVVNAPVDGNPNQPTAKMERMAFFDSSGRPINMTIAKAPNVIVGAAVTNLVAVDASAGNVVDLTLTSSAWTLSNPTNPVNGQTLTYRLLQDGTGSRTVTWGSAFDFGGNGGSAPTLTATAGKLDTVSFRYHAGLSKWIFESKSLND